MLPEKNTLPRAEAQTAANKRNNFCRPCQRHFDVARHIIGPFVRMRKIRVILWYEAIDEALQIAARGRVSIFHNDQATTSMTAKDRNRTFAQAGLA